VRLSRARWELCTPARRFASSLVLPSVSGGALSICVFAPGLAAAWSRALLKAASSACAIELEAGGAGFAGGERFAVQLAERR